MTTNYCEHTASIDLGGLQINFSKQGNLQTMNPQVNNEDLLYV